MSGQKELSGSSPSLAAEERLDEGFPHEALYHDTDVFGHEEDHDVRHISTKSTYFRRAF